MNLISSGSFIRTIRINCYVNISNAAKMIDNVVCAHFIEYRQFSSFFMLSEGKSGQREHETKRKIDWHMYVYIELRSFSLFFLCQYYLLGCLACKCSLSFAPFMSFCYPTLSWSEYTSFLANNPLRYNADDVANNRTRYRTRCIRIYSHAERIMS